MPAANESGVPEGLPPLFVGTDWSARREELLDRFARHVYGVTPSGAVTLEATERSRAPAASGAAERREVRLVLSRGARSVPLELLVYLPAGGEPPAAGWPVFVGLNFGGNQSVDPDPSITVSTSRTIDKPGVENGLPTEATRGAAAGRWPVEAIAARGYALVTLHCGDVRPDVPEVGDLGVQRLFDDDDFTGVRSDERWGTIGAWAWGLSRVLDYLADVPGIDHRRAIAIGHSRLGKTALWAAAQDRRFAGAVSNDSGCGGAAIYRRCRGERITDITSRFPHWFCRAHDRYRDAEHELPVDQHLLLALVAPRMLHVASATEDLWADPDGELLAAFLASPAYRALGATGLPEAWSDLAPPRPRERDDEAAAGEASGNGARGGQEPSEPIDPAGGTLRYHRRSGGHDITIEDWRAYLDHADVCDLKGESW